MDQWKGRVALVTGASSGIGTVICKELVKHGMTVVGCGGNVEELQAVAMAAETPNTTGKMYVVGCNFLEDTAIDKMIDEIRKIYEWVDVSINNAGFPTNDSLASGKQENWRKMLEMNIMGLCICTRNSLELMKENGITDGIIIHMGSVMGHKIPDVGKNKPLDFSHGFYYGTKFMITGYAEALRQQLKSVNSRIRVATISAGAVQTDFFSRSLDEEAAEKFYTAVQFLRPEHIAQKLINVLKTPAHVNVQDVMVQPVHYFL